MTVKELKQALDKFDDNLIVFLYDETAMLKNVSQGINEFDGALFLDDYEEDGD